MNAPKMTKAFYGQLNEQDLTLKDKNIARMREGGWFDPPLSPEDIPKHFQVFDPEMKAHVRHKLIYIMLIARSNELGGVTKFPNKSIAAALEQQYGLKASTQQVVNSIAFLKEKKLIAALNAFKAAPPPPKGMTEDQRLALDKKGFFNPRSDRMFLVWASFYANACRPKRVGWSGFDSDPRVECEEWKKAVAKIPLKYKIKSPKERKRKDGTMTVDMPARVDWDDLMRFGVIDTNMYNEILRYTEAKDYGHADAVISVMGRTEDRLFYLANREKIDEKRQKSKADRDKRRQEEMKSYGII